MERFLSIAGITIAVRATEARLFPEWPEPLQRFAVPSQPASIELTVEALSAEELPGPGACLFDSGSVWRLMGEDGGYRIECRSEVFGPAPYKVARIDAGFSRGVIGMRSDVAGLHPLDFPLDELIVTGYLSRGVGVELHSCGLIDHLGQGHIFAGVSGAGKTTTARLWQEQGITGILSDDRVIVREQDGEMRMFGTPWHGEAELALAASAPVKSIYLLEQANVNAVVPLAPAVAIARLFRCTFPPFYDPQAIAFTLGFLERVTAAVPVRELQFTRDAGAVEVVRAEGV